MENVSKEELELLNKAMKDLREQVYRIGLQFDMPAIKYISVLATVCAEFAGAGAAVAILDEEREKFLSGLADLFKNVAYEQMNETVDSIKGVAKND